MKTIAVIVQSGRVERALELASLLDANPLIAQVAVVPRAPGQRPANLPAGVAWLVPARDPGFGGALRLAVESLPSAECYLLLADDVRLPDATILACLDTLSATSIGVVAPTLVGTGRSGLGRPPLPRLLVAPTDLCPAPADRPHEVGWVSGAAMFIKAECHRRIPMDGRFYLGFEDVDFCHRARRAGWCVVRVPAPAWRLTGGPPPRISHVYYQIRNALWFTRLRGWPVRTALVAAWSAVVVLPRAAVRTVSRPDADRLLAFHGLVDGLSRLPRDDPPGMG
jgi:N-acetylglucosaminyl-diphospho-decaprenol L-rhamnosyltransferase